MIEISNLTKDYGNHRGIFTLSLNIEEGEIYGFIGPNGAGKSTTMRHLMGFSKADAGIITINGLNSWNDKEKIKKFTGYLAGEISLPNDMTGLQYLKLISKMRKMESFSYAEELIEYFEATPNSRIKKMSKGQKQKIAIVATFMHNPQVILLDEPTSGLDPLMQEKFMKLLASEKQKGKTIFMSSHIFDEVSKVCERVGIVKEGSLIKELDMNELRNNTQNTYIVKFKEDKDLSRMRSKYLDSIKNDDDELIIRLNDAEINDFISDLSTCNLEYLKEKEESLEEHFMKFYEGDADD